ncbi:hypothetical protein B0T10DRAFT_56701 [Thelonectria olida]|uniref:Uncharacterized protein n=1 Tax=Thelonectria olida TaxID=1576542 RepID=A0A9P9ANT9_9HYPO|nr:hypothetical protein B0T10DRAFT_56701 [Thelonectria olida]
MVKQAIGQAVRPLAGLCNASTAHPVRHFSSTPSLGLRAVFTETQNPNLNEVLTKIQEKIILPAHLPEKQRKMIFDPNMRNHIKQNPIIIELDGLEHKFTFMNRFHDLPNSKKAFREVLDLMQTKEDWDNLAILLAGYKKAGIKLYKFHYASMIRRAASRNQIHTIIECVKQSSKTGFNLSQDTHIIQLFLFVGKEKPETAVKWNDEILNLLQLSGQASELNPIALGQVLFAQAANVQNKTANQVEVTKETAQLKDSAQHLAQWWSRQLAENESVPASIVKLAPQKESKESKKRKDTLNLSGIELIQAIAMNIKGMSLAREILGDAAKDLEPVEQKLETHVREFVKETAENGLYREVWATAYEEIMGKKPQWNVPTKA